MLLSELMGSVCKILRNTVVIDKTGYWSDSEVALTWIKDEEKRSPWVQNRVKKVKKKSSEEHWDYVHTSINPADIGTRESSAMKIDSDQRWWYGPSLPHARIEKEKTDVKSNPDFIKERPVVTLAVHFDPGKCIKNLIDVSRFSSLQKLLRVTSYVLRFGDQKVKKVGRESFEDEISAEEKKERCRYGSKQNKVRFLSRRHLAIFRDSCHYSVIKMGS